MSARQAGGWFALGTAGVVAALVLAGSAHGLALLAYVLFACALALAVLVRRVRVALPPAPAFERLLARPAAPLAPVKQLAAIELTLAAAGASASEVHVRLRPLAGQIAAARLSRRRGVDLDRQPERARALLGARTWELVRPDRELPEDRRGGGWSRRELAALLDELEAI